MVAQLQDLRRGRICFLNGMRVKLLYCTPCRAHVRLPDREVIIKGKRFKKTIETDWAPTTRVEIRGSEQ